MARICVGLALAGSAAAEEQFYYVDPVDGVDVATAGSFEAPWKTIGFALAQNLHSQARLNLLPGVYAAESGEVFPIELPALVNVWGLLECGAVIRTDDASAAFHVAVAPGSSASNTFGNLSILSERAGIEVEVGVAASASFLEVSNVRISAERPVSIYLGAEASGQFSLFGCVFEGTAGGVLLEQVAPGVQPGNSAHLQVVASELSGGAAAALRVSANDPSRAVRVTATTTVFHASTTGVELLAGGGADLAAEIENCVFFENGAGLTDAAGPGTAAPAVLLANSILWGHVGLRDLPSYDADSYALATNLVEDPALQGIAGNIAGPPGFVDAGGGDWHLLPSSPARDAGSPAAVFHISDADGDPTAEWLLGDGLTDIGADEFYPRYQWLHPGAFVGSTARYRVLGVGDELWFAFLGPVTFFPGFGSWQLHSFFLPQPFALGVMPRAGFDDVPLVIPAHSALVGFRFMTQSLHLSVPEFQVSFSANGFKGSVCD